MIKGQFTLPGDNTRFRFSQHTYTLYPTNTVYVNKNTFYCALNTWQARLKSGHCHDAKIMWASQYILHISGSQIPSLASLLARVCVKCNSRTKTSTFTSLVTSQAAVWTLDDTLLWKDARHKHPITPQYTVPSPPITKQPLHNIFLSPSWKCTT